ncbi:MAG: PaaI family thioesterase [Xanthobacteraceae bacterium]|jgi:acyl-coenzyme A thioesterase PaaI-like protein
MTSVTEQIPEGYNRHFRTSPLTDPWEPLYSKAESGSIIIALRIRREHCNSRGFAHGGLISALADNAMGLSLHETLSQREQELRSGALTISLALDFLGSAQIGQWLEFVPRVLRAGSSLGFVDCLVQADKTPIARGNATFRIYQAANTD